MSSHLLAAERNRRALNTWLITTLNAVLLVFSAQDAGCAPWEGILEDGRHVRVDPRTNRAVIQSGTDAGTVLWDGVHTLQDDSVITVRSGLTVPNEQLMGLKHPSKPSKKLSTVQLDPACEDLVIKTCGLAAQCAAKEACDLAKQLRKTQWQAVAQGNNGAEWSSSHCKSAIADEKLFPVCDAARPANEAPCRQLVELLCGATERCEASEACQLSRQLSALEKQAQTAIESGPRATPQRQCQDLLSQHTFFPPCR